MPGTCINHEDRRRKRDLVCNSEVLGVTAEERNVKEFHQGRKNNVLEARRLESFREEQRTKTLLRVIHTRIKKVLILIE